MTALLHSFGTHIDDSTLEADVISTMAFDEPGEYIATGDVGGRISLYCRAREYSEAEEKDEYLIGKKPTKLWRPYFQFQSHLPGFDCLKSTEITERINKIAFLPQILQNKYVLCTNERAIKLWKISERCGWETTSSSLQQSCPSSASSLRLPRRLNTTGM